MRLIRIVLELAYQDNRTRSAAGLADGLRQHAAADFCRTGMTQISRDIEYPDHHEQHVNLATWDAHADQQLEAWRIDRRRAIVGNDVP